MTKPRTLFEKIWEAHVVTSRDDGYDLLWVDRHLTHEGAFHAFEALKTSGRKVRRPDLTFAIADHYVPTRNREAPIPDPEIAHMVELLRANAGSHGIRHFGMEDPDQGIVHVIGPELGITLPGVLLVCGDSHTSTHGALGALAFGLGATEVSHVLATQTIWQTRPKTLRVTVDGQLSEHVTAKDVILSIIAEIGANGASGYVVEYAGDAIEALSMEARLTICNMSIEAGARAGMIAPDEVTFEFLKGRRYAPDGADWDEAMSEWKALRSDEGAVFDREVRLDGNAIAPTVTWGVSPEHALPVTAKVPNPEAEEDVGRRQALEAAIDYMQLSPGQDLSEIKIDQVFIGSCTNGRIEDLRAAASVLKGQTAAIPLMVVPGSAAVKREAEAEGLDKVFTEAGAEWLAPSCSMCATTNGDVVPAGKRCASTTNRNFRGRQGPGSRTHLMSPAMAAAAAITGRIVDVRDVIQGGTG